MELVLTKTEPNPGTNLHRGDRICRYVEQRLIRATVPRVVLLMACLDEEPVRIVGNTPFFPEVTQEALTCPGCLACTSTIE